MKKLGLIFLIIAFSLGLVSHKTLNNDAEYKIQTLLIYNFTKYVKWKANTENVFVIGIYGNSPIEGFFNQLKTSKIINGKPIVVKVIPISENSPNCDLLYIDENWVKTAKSHMSVPLKNCLIVTNSPTIPNELTCINLKQVEDSYKFEINNKNVHDNNLEISSSLLNLALKVY